MNRLVIIDFMYMAHRHFYAVKENEARKNGQYMMTNPNTGEESARLYFIIKDIEAIFNEHKDDTVVVCSDRHTIRKDTEEGYKSNRAPDRFVELDKAAITNTENLLLQTGVSLLAMDGYEADDLIQSIVRQYKNDFDEVLIYTPDSDLSVLIDDKVSLKRYKSAYSKNRTTGQHMSFLQAHYLITKKNFSDYFSKEFGKTTPVILDFNTIMFYKSLVGDSSDNIKGITKFGPGAYNKLRLRLVTEGKLTNEIAAKMTDADFVEGYIKSLEGNYLTSDQIQQALNSLALVRPITIEIPKTALRKLPCEEYRREVYKTTWGINKL